MTTQELIQKKIAELDRDIKYNTERNKEYIKQIVRNQNEIDELESTKSKYQMDLEILSNAEGIKDGNKPEWEGLYYI